ncbi:metallophosphoesterase [Chitinophaga horti]|uniref:Metallophosphoesterase n=1 Tax=Chitinophaga horti TaxID=2920382 RepID=A0ABY6IY11_9BACT|nr:metallophosphoesterase [Chitinophaga horti]UYQ92185.1 metallophosphoesterase [Chitinophaga horti]
MRIVQLSDIHLSAANITDFRNFYRSALIKDLKEYHEKVPIDIILLTGDLVDKGGESLLKMPEETSDNCYEIFEREFIQPICEALTIRSDQVLMIPGNHDIERGKVDKYSENYLSTLEKEGILVELLQNKSSFRNVNERIQAFKNFERRYHGSNENYVYSNNESIHIAYENEKKVGFGLINDSWRCSSTLKPENHYIGYNQLWNIHRNFEDHQTVINVVAFHHPLMAFNESEREEIENILTSQNFNIVFFGHSHRHAAKSLSSSVGGYFSINARTAFNNANETNVKYQGGYNILDINLSTREYLLHARKFMALGYRFDHDVESIKGGTESGYLPSALPYAPLAKPGQSHKNDDALPSSYSADVKRIVGLLIGKSLYPESYMFVRELIQNSVDACRRVVEKYPQSRPKIIINVNTTENYLEVIDEGDGMTKSTIKHHFSVIGKSISQEFNDSTGDFDLISRFGIGFMSTYIVAEKVIIDTKNDEDEQVRFEVDDVFKGFNYIDPTNGFHRTLRGTMIKVYMKPSYSAREAFDKAMVYLRHIERLQLNLDSKSMSVPSSWNIENAMFVFEHKSVKYVYKVGIGKEQTTFIASNSGFLIGADLLELLPAKFPSIIGGEVNFLPKGIDFDMSRTKIMPTQKAEAFRREISVSVKKLLEMPWIHGIKN